MAASHTPNIWANYAPPRGPCNYKPSLMTPRCPCLRFMLHPLKSTSSFECDGCAHHASFHSMENKEEDEIRKRWEQEAREKAISESQEAAHPRKRAREIEYARDDAPTQARLSDSSLIAFQSETASEAGHRAAKTKPKRKAKAKPRGKTAGSLQTGSQTRGRITELEDDDDDYIELD